MSSLANIRKSNLSNRLLLYVIVMALFFSILSTAAQMVIDHDRKFNQLEETYAIIEQNYLVPLAASLYALDEEQLKLQVTSLLNFQDLDYVKVVEQRAGKSILLVEGGVNPPKILTRMYPLIYAPPTKDPRQFGELIVEFNLESFYAHILQEGLIAFSTNAAGLGIMAFCIFLLFQYSLTNHLIAMSRFADKLNLNEMASPIALKRKTPRLWSEDELHQLATALNKMRQRLKSDLAQREKREERLLEYADELKIYEHITSSTSDLMSFVDTSYRYRAVNSAYLKAHDRTREEIIGVSVDQLAGKEAFETVIKDHLDRSFTGEIVQYQSWFEYAGKGRRFMDVSYNPFMGEDGNIQGVVVDVHDLTELKRLEDERLELRNQLQQVQKMEAIGTLAGGIAHDFNNILSSIIGFTELALEDTRKSTEQQDNLQEVYEAALRAKELVKQILAFARKSDEEVRPTKLGEIVNDVIRFIRSSAPSSIEISHTINSDPYVTGNASEMYQVVVNLCTNALQSMQGDSGVLHISLNRTNLRDDGWLRDSGLPEGEYARLVIADDGPGIEPENLDKIFEPYFTTKDIGEGTGMGLSMVKGLVERYGGLIKANSIPDVETKFTIFLPLTEQVKSNMEKRGETTLPGGDEHILLIDDELAIVKMGARTLESLGYTVTIKTCSEEALELFRVQEADFDLIITDMTMPRMTGDELVLAARQIRPDIPVILSTGYSNKMSPEKAEELGIDLFIYKPFTKQEIGLGVRKVLEEKKSSKK